MHAFDTQLCQEISHPNTETFRKVGRKKLSNQINTFKTHSR